MFKDLKNYEKRIYSSQLGQDGIIERIFEVIGVTNKYFAAFGDRNLIDLSNVANLRFRHNWSGLSMDTNPGHPLVKKEFITAENINDIFKKYDVPQEFDFLSIDVDGNDLYLWDALNYNVRVVSIEYNSNFPLDVSVAIPYSPDNVWDNYSNFYGASLGALNKIAAKKSYSLVAVVDTLDAFYVRNDLLVGIEWLTPEELFPKPIACHNPDNLNRPWAVI